MYANPSNVCALRKQARTDAQTLSGIFTVTDTKIRLSRIGESIASRLFLQNGKTEQKKTGCLRLRFILLFVDNVDNGNKMPEPRKTQKSCPHPLCSRGMWTAWINISLWTKKAARGRYLSRFRHPWLSTNRLFGNFFGQNSGFCQNPENRIHLPFRGRVSYRPVSAS